MKHQQYINDSDLLYQIAQGDRAAFTQLYTRYANNLLRFADSFCSSREVSEEIVQELFLKVWLSRESLVNVASIKPYLYQSAKNMLLNYIKRVQTESRALHVIEFSKDKADNQLENDMVFNEYNELAHKAIDLLPLKRREIFKLRLNDDLSLDEISAKLQISKSVVKKQLYSGINFVRCYLSKHGQIMTWLITFLAFVRK